MRAIIIDDKDARALIERLELQKFTGSTFGHNTRHVFENHQLSKHDQELLITDIHARFHYIVVSWLQEQGANTVR